MKLPLLLDRDAGEMMRERGSEVNRETARLCIRTRPCLKRAEALT